MKKIVVFIVYFIIAQTLNAQTTNYQVHSLFIINIAKYSTWPTNSGEFNIVVFGKSKIYDELMKQVAGKNINGFTAKVTQVNDVSEIGSAHLIFLADGKSGNLQDVVKATEGKPTLVIAEREGLFRKGAGFSFVIMDNNTLRFDINNTELERRNIKVSKNLTSLANSVI